MPRVWEPQETRTFDYWEMWDHIKLDVWEKFHLDPQSLLKGPWYQLLDLVEGLMNTPPEKLVVPNKEGYELRPVWKTRTQYFYYNSAEV